MRRMSHLLVSFVLLSTLTACPPVGTTGGGPALHLSLDAARDPQGPAGLQIRFHAQALPAVWDRADFTLSGSDRLATPLSRSVAASDMAAQPDGGRLASRLFPLVPPGQDYSLQVRLFDGDTAVAGARLDHLSLGAGSTVITATVAPLTNPVITGFTPDTALARPGDTIHVLGSGFADAAGRITLHDRPLSVRQWTDTDITAVLPADATSGMVTVVAAGGLASPGRPFAIRRDELFLVGQTAGLQALSLSSFTAMGGYPAQTGSGPGRMAYDRGRDRLYGVLEGSRQVAILDAATLQPVPGSPIAVDGTPAGVAYDPVSDRIAVTCVDTNRLTVLDGTTLRPVSGSPLSTGLAPSAVIAAASRFYWADQGGGTVSAVQAGTLAPLAGSPAAVGTNPVALAYDAGRKRLGVLNQVNATLVLLDADTLKAAAQGSTGPAPTDLTYDPTTDRYVATTYNGNGVQSFDPVGAGTLVNRLIDAGPMRLAIDPDHGRLLVAHPSADTITALNLPGLDLLPGMPIAVGRGPAAITYDSLHDRFWVANQTSQQWALLGRSAVAALPDGPVSVGVIADRAAYDSSRHRLYVPQREGRVLEAVDAGTGLTVSGLRQSLGTAPGPIAYDPVHDQILVANRGSGTLQAFRAATFAPVGSPLSVGGTPVQVRYDPRQDRFYVLDQDRHNLYAYDAGSLSAVANSPVATASQPTDLQPSADGRSLYVLSRGGNAIEVYDAAALTRTASWSQAGTPVALATDPGRGRLYALISGVGMVGLSAATGQPLPGSPWSVPNSLQQLLFDPVADRLYGLDATNRQIHVWGGETLQPVSGSPFAAGLAATHMLIAQ